MGRASTHGDAAASPRTRCTNCRTVFEVSTELLSSSDTRVRCGECLSIFDALANLCDPDEEIGPDESPPSDGDDDPSAAGREDAPRVADGDDDPSATGRDDDPHVIGEGDDPHADGDDGSTSGPSDPGDDTGSLDVTYSDFDLFSGDAQLPSVAYLDDTADTPEFDFDTVDIDEDETFSDTLFAHDATIEASALGHAAGDASGEIPPRTLAGADGKGAAGTGGTSVGSDASTHGRPLDLDPDFVDDDEPVERLVFEYREREPDVAGASRRAGAAGDAIGAAAPIAPGAGGARGAPIAPDAGARRGTSAAPTARIAPWLLRGLLLLAFGALLVGLYAYRERERLHNDPLARPVLLAACRAIGCAVPSRVELSSLKLLERKVFTHPTEPDALVINVAFRNAAAFEQRFPVLVVRLRDRLGRVVAERDFSPSDYLEGWAPGDTLGAGTRLDITLEVDDPGDGAESYEFEFREAEH